MTLICICIFLFGLPNFVDFLSTTARLLSMRWHVTALAAVWLIIMGWCGSVVMGQPIAGLIDQSHPLHHPPAGQTIPEMWALLDAADGPTDTIRDRDDLNGDLYYFPAVPIMKRQQSLDDDSGWQSQVNWIFRFFFFQIFVSLYSLVLLLLLFTFFLYMECI